MHDIAAGRQHDVRRRRPILAQQAEGAAGIRPVGVNAPDDAAGHVGEVLAEPGAEREHGLARGGRCGRRGGHAAAGPGGAVTGGARIEGGRAGADPGPDGGARLTAPPPMPSGSGN